MFKLRDEEEQEEDRPGGNERLAKGEEGSEMPGNYTPLAAPLPALDSLLLCQVHFASTNVCVCTSRNKRSKYIS